MRPSRGALLSCSPLRITRKRSSRNGGRRSFLPPSRRQSVRRHRARRLPPASPCNATGGSTSHRPRFYWPRGDRGGGLADLVGACVDIHPIAVRVACSRPGVVSTASDLHSPAPILCCRASGQRIGPCRRWLWAVPPTLIRGCADRVGEHAGVVHGGRRSQSGIGVDHPSLRIGQASESVFLASDAFVT